MASINSIRRALLRPGHFLSLQSDRLLYVSPARSLGGRLRQHGTMGPRRPDTRRNPRPLQIHPGGLGRADETEAGGLGVSG